MSPHGARSDLLASIAAELENGETAKLEGNSGKARVCARRAVGLAIRAFYDEAHSELPGSSAYNAIRVMLEDGAVSEDIRSRLAAFTQRLSKDSPDDESYWPLDVDLVREARWIISRLGYSELSK